MEFLIGLLIIAAALWFFFGRRSPAVSSGSSHDEQGQSKRSKQRVLDANSGWLEERWRMAREEKAEGHLQHFANWYFDAPTERQTERLKRDGISIKGSPTKGQVSDVIGLFEEPDDDDLEKLKFFGVTLQGALRNQTRARHEIAKLDSEPKNEMAWAMRPASAMQKEFYKFIASKPPAGLTYEQAEKTIGEALEAMPESKSDEWYSFESLVSDFDDRDFRGDAGIRKPSLADIRQALEALKAEKRERDDVYDPYIVAEKLLEMKPSLARNSAA